MTHRFAAPVIAGLLLASPVLAAGKPPTLSARGELRAAYVDLHGNGGVLQGGEAHDLWSAGGGASLDVASGALHLQLDLAGEDTIGRDSADDTVRSHWGGALHLGLRDPERGSLGAFVSAGRVSINDVGGDDPRTTVWGAGIEAQAYFHTTTLYLQAGYLDRESIARGGDPDALKNAPFVRAVGRWFPREPLALEAWVALARGRMDPDEDSLWLVDLGLEAEYRFGRSPVSGFVGYRGARYEQSDDDDVLFEHRFGLGLRIHYGQPSPRDQDRRGVSLSLPRQLEWNGQIAGALE